VRTNRSWSTFLKLDNDADIADYKLVLIGRLSLVAVISILFLIAVNIVMKYPLINVLIDVVALVLIVVVFIAVRHRRVMLASLFTTIGLMIAISVGSIVSYSEMRNNGAENLIIAILVLIVALFNSRLRVFLFLLSFGLLIWLKQYKMHVLDLPMGDDFYVELVNVSIICIGIYFSTAFFKAGLQKNLDKVTKLNSGLNEQREMLANLNKEKDELIGIVAHDLKNPLHVISSALPILKEQLDKTLTDDQSKILEAIDESAQGMVKHIAQILNVNKMEMEGIHLIPKDHDVGALLQKLVDLHQHSSKLKKIKIEGDIAIGKHIIYVDENCVNRVFENLLSNAIKYTTPGKAILLSLVDLDSKVQIRFQDQGLGISEADQENLFKKYESLSSKPTGNESSTGMGLFSVKKYLAAIKGTIDVESEVGVGTTFIVTLPRG
jgi:signal transduction histidine kinase